MLGRVLKHQACAENAAAHPLFHIPVNGRSVSQHNKRAAGNVAALIAVE
jgi:hypothetical protein